MAIHINKQKLGIVVFVVGFFVVVGLWIQLFFSSGTDTSPGEELQTNLQADITAAGKDVGKETGENVGENAGEDREKDAGKNTGEDVGQETTTSTTNNEMEQVVSILFPPVYTHAQITTLTTILEKESGIKTNAKHLDSRSSYYKAMERFLEQGSSLDLLVLPSTHFQKAKQRGLGFQLPKTLQRFYHQSFHGWMYEEDITIIPFALDPIVVYKNTDALGDTALTSSRQLLHYAAEHETYDTATATRKQAIKPIFTNAMLNELSQQKPPFPHAHALLQGFMDYTKTYTTLDWLLLITSTTKDTISNTAEGCKTPSTLCQVVPGTTSMGFGLLSESAEYQEILLNDPSVAIDDVPFKAGNAYPTLGWGIAINSQADTQQLKAIELWVEAFTKISVNTSSIPYPRYRFGPTYNLIQRQSVNKTLQDVQAFKTTGKLIESTGSDQQPLLYQPSFLEYLRGDISEKAYIQKITDLETTK